MRTAVISLAAVLCMAASVVEGAESDTTLNEIRAQLVALTERVERLEEVNRVLAAENERLRARYEGLARSAQEQSRDVRAQVVAMPEPSGDHWTSRVSLKGDLRYRHEHISDESRNSNGVRTADRDRHRIRARLNLAVEATETIALGFGLATAEDGDPRSTNQSLSGVFSRKSIDLDLAYFDWQFAAWGNLIGGKMQQPFFKPGQSLFWDNDIHPEGLAVGFDQGPYFGTLYGYWLSEVSGPQTAITSDSMLYGGQLGVRLPVGDSTLVLAGHYYDVSAGRGRTPFYDDDSYGNTAITVPAGASTARVLAYDYRVIDLAAELNTSLASVPLQLWADLAQNRGTDEHDTAWGIGLLLGKAGDVRSWELGISYQLIEKDALFAQLIDSDFGAGNTDSAGFVVRAAYAPLENWVVNATYFINERYVDVLNEAGQVGADYRRLQLDFNVKF